MRFEVTPPLKYLQRSGGSKSLPPFGGGVNLNSLLYTQHYYCWCFSKLPCAPIELGYPVRKPVGHWAKRVLKKGQPSQNTYRGQGWGSWTHIYSKNLEISGYIRGLTTERISKHILLYSKSICLSNRYHYISLHIFLPFRQISRKIRGHMDGSCGVKYRDACKIKLQCLRANKILLWK